MNDTQNENPDFPLCVENKNRYDRNFYKNFFWALLEKAGVGVVQGRDEMVELLADNADCHAYKAKEFVIREGEQQNNLYILLSGAFRCFNVDEITGKEVTNCLLVEPGTPGIAAATFDRDAKAMDWIQALEENSELIQIPLSGIKQLEHFPAFSQLFLWGSELGFQRSAEVVKVRTLRAEERCIWLHEKHPEMEKRIQKQYLASYLGMDRAVYSRCIKKLNL